MNNDFTPDGGRQRYFGVYPALVVNIVDPEDLGRVQVKFPWLGEDGDEVTAWSTLATPYADDDQGLQIMPEVDSQVVVAFEAGNLRRPYILGACWNGRAATPESPQDDNDIRTLKTRSGSELTFNDSQAGASITLSLANGHKLELQERERTVTLTHGDGHKIVFTAAGNVEITATAMVEVNASVMNVHAPVANFDGIINCQTLIASSTVVSPMYSPGVGNLW